MHKIALTENIASNQNTALEESPGLIKWPSIEEAYEKDAQLQKKFGDKLLTNYDFNRSLVSFQASKGRASFRWYKFKEAFSAPLLEYLVRKNKIAAGKILDPFAGTGTTLFVASNNGLDAEGIELLPIGQEIISTRMDIQNGVSNDIIDKLKFWAKFHPWENIKSSNPIGKLKITAGAYPEETETSICKYIAAYEKEEPQLQSILKFALLCILENISYTRKDGQYLRWDHRSGRRQGEKPFDKGTILSFDEAITTKLKEIVHDIQIEGTYEGLFPAKIEKGNIKLYRGSCLEIMPTIDTNSYECIITSPPYCNRYDYTRTYALELALLGADEQHLSSLRQSMLSCTVENRAKDLLKLNPKWGPAIEAADKQELLQYILKYLEDQKAKKVLNNNGIPRMVRGYFYEMACVIYECYRVLKSNSLLFMVNDNVRYAGVGISVDLILSSIAQSIGFNVDKIFVLPKGKGNSSQQMGEHGREKLRKCIYTWSKRKK